jgi:hypothetical protein
MLTDPNPDDPLVPDIAHLYKTDRTRYEATPGSGQGSTSCATNSGLYTDLTPIIQICHVMMASLLPLALRL